MKKIENMKAIEKLLSELKHNLVKVWVEEDNLRFSAPKGALTQALRTELLKHKTELMTFLSELQRESENQFPPIEPVSRNDGHLPVSFAQQRLWFLDQLEGGSATYNISAALRLEGALDRKALSLSLLSIVQRHENLHIGFRAINGTPVVQLTDNPHPLSIINLEDRPVEEQEREVGRLINEEARRPFDLSQGPLFRSFLLQKSRQSSVLLLTIHHIIFDDWSLSVLLQELSILYEAFCQGKPSPLAPLPIQYADFAHWQRQWLSGERLSEQINYWKKQLTGAPAILELPTDRPRPPIQSNRGAIYHLTLSAQRTEQLKRLSQQTGTTLFITLLSAFAILLSRYSGQTDIVIGSPIANRRHSQIESLIGFFVNTLVLRLNLEGNPHFDELLRRVKQVALGAYAHQDLPVEKLIEELQPERNLSHAPLFQVMFVLQNAPTEEIKLSGLTLTPFLPENTVAKFDLTLSLEESAQGSLDGILEYNTELFDGATIERLAGHFQTLIEGIVSNSAQSIHDLPLLTADEQHQLLVEWNDTTTSYPDNQCVHQLFEAQVEQTPEAVAVVFEDQQLSYLELNARANQLAHHLLTLGVKPDHLVGLGVERSLEMIIGLLGILKAGGAYVPLDPNYPTDRLAFMLEDSQISVLLTQNRLMTPLPVPKTTTVVYLDTDFPTISKYRSSNPVTEVQSDNLAYVIYTSGSTGQPKGVLVEHQGVCNLARAQIQAFDVQPNSRVLQFASLNFDASLSEIVMTLCSGAQLCLAKSDDLLPGRPLGQLLQQQATTHLTLPPTALGVMSLEDGSNLSHLIVAGEAGSDELVTKWSKGRRFFNAYGPTEATVCATIAECSDSQQKPPIGRPIANTQIYLLDQYNRPVPIGVPGEIHIGGVGVARGYLNRPLLSSDKFIPNPFSDRQARLYKTGDLGRYLSDGNIEFLGRIDNQVKIRGFRIELGEIEAVLAQYPLVRENAVIVHQDSTNDKRLVAYLVSHQGQVIDNNELRAFLKERFPDYMIPQLLVQIDTMPMTPNGKIDRRALARLAVDQVNLSTASFVAPRTPEEELLAGIWASVLGREAVGVFDNFFDLGGHSLLATQVMSRLRETFSVELPLRILFESPTVADLNEQINQARRGESPEPITPILPDQPLSLSFAQQRLWFLDQLEGQSATYNIPAVLSLEGRLQLTALENSLRELVQRHETLRTTFPTVNGQALQTIHPVDSWPFNVIDLQPLSLSEPTGEVQRLVNVEAQRPFDLSEGPLFRATLLQLGSDLHVLLLTMHHIISDGWSIGVLVRELGSLYEASCRNEPSPLSPLPIQYADFAHWQRQYLSGERLSQQRHYWSKQLAGAPALLELPTDHPRPPIQRFQGATVNFELGTEPTRALKTLSQQQGTTLFMTLLAAFGTVLSRYSGQTDIVIGSPIANRTHRQLELLIGFFVNTLVLRIDLAGNPSFDELIKRVRPVALEAYAHQDIPFEQLVEELQLERTLSHTPLFQVMFTLQNAPIEDIKLPELTLNPLVPENTIAKFDLTLSMEETAFGMEGLLEYNTDLFERATIERLAGHFQTLIDGLISNPQQPIQELPLLTATEQHQLLVEWNDTTADYPIEQCVHQLFEAQVEKTPEALAVVFEEQQLTYRELNQRANQLAHYLQTLGVKPEVLVGICIERSIDMVIGLLGILKAGGAYVPLDPTYPKNRLTFMLEDAGVSVLLTVQKLVAELPTPEDAQLVCLDSDWEIISPFSDKNTVSRTQVSNIAYVIYTSGSTGQPKGVLIPHSNVTRLFAATDSWFHFDEQDVWTLFHSYAFDFSVWELWGALFYGGRLVIVPYWLSRSPEDFYELLCTQRVTVLNQTPSAFRQLIQAEERNGMCEDFSLRLVIFGGEALEFQSLKPWFERHPDDKPQLVNMYGITETTVHVTVRPLSQTDLFQPGSLIGVPIPDLQAYLLNKSLQLVPIGVPGELHIGGAGLARGYLNRPILSSDKFIPNPFSDDPNARLYKTGDLARYLPDGNLEYLGRIDNQVKIRGFRIELGEIEAVLAQYEAVRENAVLVHEESANDKRLVAYFVPQTGEEIDNTRLREFLQQRLPDYMIPKAFVSLEAMPLTPNGKIDRRALTPLSVNSYQLSEKSFVEPRTSEEALLADIWGAVLGRERVGVHDNFFEIGGDSILSIQVISRATQAGLQVTPKQLFQHQTIAELAAVASTTVTLKPAAEQGLVLGTVPLTPIQHWFFEPQRPEPDHFNQSFLFEVSPNLTPAQLEAIVAQLLEHHDVLRLRFSDPQEQWITDNCSLVTDNDSVILVNDLSDLPAEQLPSRMAAIEAKIQASLSLSNGPLLRVAWFLMGHNQPNRLLIIIHHLAVDGVSWRILLEDFATAYQQLNRQKRIKLPAKTTSFKQWALHLTEYASSEALATELEYWLAEERFKVAPLPVDYPLTPEANTVASQAVVEVSLSVEHTQALLGKVHQAYHTQINDLLLTALVQSLAQWIGYPSLLIDLEGHGREDLFEDVDISRTVGWFTTIFPVLLEMGSVGSSPGEALKSIKEQLRQIPQKGIGYGLLRYLNSETAEQLHALPQAQLSFNYLGQFQQGLLEEPFLETVKEASDSKQSKQGYRSHWLGINGFIYQNQLQLSWDYSENLYERATIERLAQDFMTALASLIVHCQSPEAGGYTPSDFPLAHLEQATLDNLIGQRQIEDIYPLSPMQQGMLFHSLYSPSSGVYVEQLTVDIESGLDISAFQQAWQKVLDRYAVLRTAFVWEGLEQPIQIVYPSAKLRWVQEDWRSLTAIEQQEQLAEFLNQDQKLGFELNQAPLMRVFLIHMASDRYQFLLSFHHLLMDGWCLPILFKDFLAFYEASCQGQTLDLESPRRYRDYIAWLPQQDIDKAQTFWKEHLQGVTAPTPFRVDKVSDTEPERYEEQTLQLSNTTTERLQSLARQHHLTLNTLVQGAWALLLSRYSGEERIVFGATVSGRPADLVGVESIVGLFINTLPVPALVSSETALLPWLQTLQTQQVEREQYSFTPLVDIQGWSEVPGGIPLFESLVVFENYPVDNALNEPSGSLKIGLVSAIEKTNYPLTLVAGLSKAELFIKLSYNPTRFESETVSRMMGHIESLLEGMVAAPEQTLADLPLLTPAERHQLLVEWNDTQVTYPHDQGIHQLFEAQVENTPEAIAVVFENEQLSYLELNRLANQLAHHLQTLGVQPEARVGICIDRSLLMVIGLLAVLKAGGSYLPLDPSSPKARLAFMLADAGVLVLLTTKKLLNSLPEHQAQVVCLDSDWQMTISPHSDENLVSQTLPENLAYMIYTSGSTGQPKGTLITHQGLTNYLCWCTKTYPIALGEGSAVHSSFGFDATITSLFSPLLVGKKVILVPEENEIEALSALLSSQADVSLIKITPTHLEILSQLLPKKAERSTHSLIIGGEALLGDQLSFFRTYAPQTRMINEYGPTETVVGCCVYEVSETTPQQGAVPIGRAIANTQLYLLHHDLQPVPFGVPGELYIGGVGLARGYQNRPELTAEKFLPNPFSDAPNARLYKTGDLARYLPDGNLEYLGRIDNQVKIRGFRIELGEIEAVLAQNSAVRENAVIVHDESLTNDKRLVAYLVPQTGQEIENTQLRKFLQQRLPNYMIPKAFVSLEAMPLTTNGKIDRHALVNKGFTPQLSEETFVAPRTPDEELLASIWKAVLGKERVGVFDNFFELGGDSILSIQVISRASQAGLKITPKQVFQHQTVAELALVAGDSHLTVIAEQGLVIGEVPLIPIQHWFFEQHFPEPNHFNQSVLLEVSPSLTPVDLEAIIAQLLQHHDALRLRFSAKQEQQITDNCSLITENDSVIMIKDLSDLSIKQQRPTLEATAAQLQTGLSLSTGPLLRVALFQIGQNKPNRLLIIIHHQAVDGVSWRILLEDFATAYQQRARGEFITLPPKTTSFKQWADRLMEYALSEAVEAELEYWLAEERLKVAELPVDYPFTPQANSIASQAQISVSLSVEHTQALLSQVHQAYHTQINDILLTALVQSLAPWVGSSRLLIELEGHGREEFFEDLDLSRTVGWFTSLFPVLLDLETVSSPPGEAIKFIKEQLRLLPQKGIGYGLLRYLNSEAAERLQALPQAQVSFNYLGQFQQVLSEAPFLGMADESSGIDHSKAGYRQPLLGINGLIHDGQLQILWNYSENLYQRATIERLSQAFVSALTALIIHCQSPQAGGYTPSDFPLTSLDQATLDRIIDKRPIEDIYPLSPMQQGMLFHSLYSPESGVYVEQLMVTIESEFDIPAFQQAWQQVIERYTVLRTALVWDGLEQALQIVYPSVELPWVQQDWRGLTSNQQQEQLADFLIQDQKTGFDLTQAPLMRYSLIQLADNLYQFIWSFHHLLLDGWCLPILFQEVLAFYQAGCQGQPLRLEQPRRYRDYIAWLQQQDIEKAQTFWKKQLEGFTAPTPFRVDKRADTEQEHYDEQTLSLSKTTTDGVQSFARHHHMTLNTLVQGAWAMLLSHYSGEEMVVFGATVSGRPSELAGIDSMVGLFINTLPVRVLVPSEYDLLPWLETLHAEQVERDQYSFSFLVDIQGWSEVPGGMPLFESLVVFENYPVDDALKEEPSNSLKISSIHTIEKTNYPLTLTVVPSTEFLFKLSYNTHCFDSDTVSRMMGHLQTLLEGMVARPEQRLAELPLLTPAERHQLLVEWNDTTTDYPIEQCVHQLFEAQVEKTPSAIAVVFEDQQLTYRELNQRANQLAHDLQTLGVKPEVLVGICIERSIEMVIGLLGILKAGGAYVPLDPAYPEARLAFMLEDAGVPILLTQSPLIEKLPSTTAQLVCLDEETFFSSAQDVQENPNTGVKPSNLAYMIYTSGSTGKPKGAMNSHLGICNRLLWMQDAYSLTKTDHVLQKTPFSFDVSVWEFFWPLLVGARLVVAQPGGHQDSAYLVQTIEEHQITTLHFVPSMLQVFVQEQGLSNCSSLKRVICSGEALPFELQQRFLARLTGVELHNLYGPTEAAVDVTYWACQPQTSIMNKVPIGRPVANIQIYLLDDSLNPTPIGVPGELHIGGVGLARGYFNRPELTAEKFIPNPFSHDQTARLYKTGDLARYLPDGNIEYLNRLDNQVKIRGFRIELGEIQEVLAQYSAVQENAVIVHGDSNNDKRLVAYLVPKSGQEIDNSQLRDFLQQRLPDYMIPKAFIYLEAMPLTTNGKIDRRALLKKDFTPQLSEDSFVSPRTHEEELLADIWAVVLRRERVGIFDNFFELGGDSILSIQVSSRATQAGLKITPKQVFQHQTIAELAAVVGTTQVTQAEQGLVTGTVPLTPIQHWFFEQHLPKPHHFNQSILLEVSPSLTPAHLESIVAQLIQHHDALRLCFSDNREQRITDNCSLIMENDSVIMIKDLSGLSAEQQRPTLEATAAELQGSLSLSTGPLLRAAWFQMGLNQSNRLLIIIHHQAVDGVSWRILLEDVATAYRQLEREKRITLPPKTTSFKQWADRLMEYAQSEALSAELDYWLADIRVKVATLPVDYEANLKENTVATTTQVDVYLSVEQTQALLSEVPQAYHTQINDVLLTALVQSFAGWTNSPRLLVDLEGHGREELFEDIDLSRTVGWFTSLFPVLLELETVYSPPGEAIKSIKEQLRQIPQKGVGYGLLRYLNSETAVQLQALPQAQVIFNYLGQFQQALSEAPFLGMAQESSGQDVSPEGQRRYLLDINCLIHQEQLHILLAYSENIYQQATIERLAQDFLTALISIIAHCQSPETGGFTPSDFPEAELSQEELDNLIDDLDLD